MHDLIQKRRSTVLFSSEKIEKSILQNLFKAAQWAASSLNQQPWRFIYGLKGDSYYDDLLACLTEKNQEWAGNAPMLLLTIAQVISDYKDRENIYAWHDTGMAYANFVFQAISEGLSVHPMGGFDRGKTKLVVDIPERYEPVAFAAVGYRSDSSDFSPELLKRENSKRTRKPIHEILFHGKFGNEPGI